jgi:hypothetical protein
MPEIVENIKGTFQRRPVLAWGVTGGAVLIVGAVILSSRLKPATAPAKATTTGEQFPTPIRRDRPYDPGPLPRPDAEPVGRTFDSLAIGVHPPGCDRLVALASGEYACFPSRTDYQGFRDTGNLGNAIVTPDFPQSHLPTGAVGGPGGVANPVVSPLPPVFDPNPLPFPTPVSPPAVDPYLPVPTPTPLMPRSRRQAMNMGWTENQYQRYRRRS